MGFRGGGGQIKMMMPFTRGVKILVISSVVIWFVVQVVAEQFLFGGHAYLTEMFALTPIKVIEFWIWQPVTYMFFHDLGPFHILFNMLILWWIGAELEQHWGTRFFLAYFFVCGIGAALIYVLAATTYAWTTGNLTVLASPVIGASGAVFGLMLAYGIVFGERVVYFMFVFPMKARYFIMILGGIEFVMVLNNGIGGGRVANMAHLGGIISGFLFLVFWSRWSKYKKGRKEGGGRKLRLVVDNQEVKRGPKYWN